ncbi:MAG TPA: hypothetical protein VG713_09595 [Pirellulales bacterium]|nr:hypothetical protein [Pirellulales bacterium]
MFKKILLFLGAVFLLFVVGCISLIFWAQRSGAHLQDRFFAAVDSGDPEQVLVLCAPELRAEIDDPVLDAWLAEVHDKLGKYQGLSKSDFETHANVTSKGSLKESKGTVHFEHGDATSDLETRDGLLTFFSVKSDKIPEDWFHGPSETTIYRERAERFIRLFFDRDVSGAAAMMHEDLRRELPDDKLKSMIDDVAGKAGAIQSVTYQNETFTADRGQLLTLKYQMVCEQAALTASIEFRFIGMKGHLWGFDFKSTDESAKTP